METDTLSIAEEMALEVLRDFGAEAKHIPRRIVLEVMRKRGFTAELTIRSLASLVTKRFLTIRTVAVPRPDTEYRMTPKGILYDEEI